MGASDRRCRRRGTGCRRSRRRKPGRRSRACRARRSSGRSWSRCGSSCRRCRPRTARRWCSGRRTRRRRAARVRQNGVSPPQDSQRGPQRWSSRQARHWPLEAVVAVAALDVVAAARRRPCRRGRGGRAGASTAGQAGGSRGRSSRTALAGGVTRRTGSMQSPIVRSQTSPVGAVAVGLALDALGRGAGRLFPGERRAALRRAGVLAGSTARHLLAVGPRGQQLHELPAHLSGVAHQTGRRGRRTRARGAVAVDVALVADVRGRDRRRSPALQSRSVRQSPHSTLPLVLMQNGRHRRRRASRRARRRRPMSQGAQSAASLQ